MSVNSSIHIPIIVELIEFSLLGRARAILWYEKLKN